MGGLKIPLLYISLSRRVFSDTKNTIVTKSLHNMCTKTDKAGHHKQQYQPQPKEPNIYISSSRVLKTPRIKIVEPSTFRHQDIQHSTTYSLPIH